MHLSSRGGNALRRSNREHIRVTRARVSADDDTAIALFDEALRLWRGDALAGLNSPWLNEIRHSLHRQRLAAELDRNDITLRRGYSEGLLDELFARCAQHPWDERLAAQLMHALCLAGRTAEALGHYQIMRKRLAEDLGADPGPVLGRIHRSILRGEITRATPPALRRDSVPGQLPRDVPGFAGRGAELAQLDAR